MENMQAHNEKAAQWRERFRNIKELEKEINRQLGHSCAERKLGEFTEHLIDKYGLGQSPHA